jgi:hypothetical protein
MTESEVKQSIASWQAHLNHADTWRLQQKIFDRYLKNIEFGEKTLTPNPSPKAGEGSRKPFCHFALC